MRVNGLSKRLNVMEREREKIKDNDRTQLTGTHAHPRVYIIVWYVFYTCVWWWKFQQQYRAAWTVYPQIHTHTQTLQICVCVCFHQFPSAQNSMNAKLWWNLSNKHQLIISGKLATNAKMKRDRERAKKACSKYAAYIKLIYST